MSEARVLIDVIKKMLAGLAKLDDEQLANLLNGTAQFKYYSPGEVKTARKKKAAPPEPDAFVLEKWRKGLDACESQEEGIEYLKSLKLGVASTKAFASHLGCNLSGARNQRDRFARIVQGTIVARLDAESIRRT